MEGKEKNGYFDEERRLYFDRINKLSGNEIEKILNEYTEKIFVELLTKELSSEEIEKVVVKLIILNSEYQKKYKK